MIVLTEKDADFICKFVRDKLEDLLKTKEEIDNKRDKLLHLSGLLRTRESEKDYQDILELAKQSSEECEKTFLEEKAKLEKIIELATVGSENEN